MNSNSINKGNNDFLAKRRLNYIIIFIIFIIIRILLYVYDPYGLVSKYFGIDLLISTIFASFILVMIAWYQYAYTHKDTLHINENTPTPGFEVIQKSLLFIFGLIVSGLFIYLIVYFSGDLSSSNNIFSLIINLFLIITILSLVYKFLTAGKYFENIPIVKLIINSILYIPCLFTGIIEMIIKLFNKEKSSNEPLNLTYLVLIVITILLFIIYLSIPFLEKKFILQGGKQLLSEPYYTDQLYTIASYHDLNKSDDFEYQYGLSFWVFIDARPPSTSASYEKYVSLLNFGNKPNIMYKADTNTLIIVVEQKGLNKKKDKNKNIEFDDHGNQIIYKNKKVLLQKWNNIVINYKGGTLDIFLNGELVKSSINIVPYMTYDNLTIGADNGVKGGVCNVVYFNEPLNLTQVYYIYNMSKDKKIPIGYSK
jgi:hypothetical protein